MCSRYLGREDAITINISAFPSSPSFLLLNMTSYGMEYRFGQLGLAVSAVSSPNFLCTPNLHAGRAV